MAALDLTGLRSHVSIRDVQATYRRRGTPNGRRWWVIAVIVAIYLTGQAVFIGILLPATGLPEDVRRAVYGGFLAFTGLYAAGLMAIIWRNAARLVRVDRMARVNGFVYEDGPAHVAGLTGSIASHSSFTFVADALGGGPGSPLPHSFVAANLGIRPGRSIRRGGLVQVPLDRRTPHIVLENRRVGLLRSTGSNFRADQRLRLEGDFDRTFSLYCPRGYEPDALYIFTPDLMALLLDLAGDCEAELIDGNLVLYRRRPWAWWRPRDVSTLAALVDAVGSKARRQTARYEDWRRTGDEVIASAGRRLRLRPSPGGVLATIVPVAFVAYGAAAWVGLV